MKVTIDDVAEKAGVSKTTVSRILNGNFGHNKPETREKVLQVIKELDYQPNALAKGLKQMKTNTIGIILSNLQNSFWISVLEGVEDVCQRNGYSLMICNSNENAQLEEDHIKGLRHRQVDGIIVNATLKNRQLYETFIEENYPLVSINREIYELPIDMVLMNNIKGAKQGVEHLIDLGKMSILLMVYPVEGVSPRIDRIEGYKQALAERGIAFNEENIQIVTEGKGNAKARVMELLSGENKYDAIFSTNNQMTLEILEGIKQLGLQVPADIALLGYDETVWSMHVDPPLTTVKQPAYEMGELAAKRLIQLIESKRKLKPKTVLLEPELIIRKSCGIKEK
ncbi:LacI family DNA-binding transcriptional regulator [Bacillus canaveralius]|uniref:LacI family DNA-binding transcriptional regulator n=1 Tax=Bacillus canaveralius TaxID=1403243 RepID=UPI000F7B0623|nr:LacI family DNA-binding transcriptional regulator [Bacillus canaveralius]RSK55161.1 LacI family transcriptional regulator [Bacillus canaveralius]